MSTAQTIMNIFSYKRTYPSMASWLLALLLPAVCLPVWLFVAGETGVETLTRLLLCLLLVVCSYTDTRWKRIPNWATYSAFLWALTINTVASLAGFSTDGPVGVIGIGNSLLGAVACGGVMMIVYSTAGSGAGDVKLACALGSLLGVELGLHSIVWCHVLAGIFALGWIVYELGPVTVAQIVVGRLGKLICPTWSPAQTAANQKLMKKPLPLAAFFAAGVVVSLLGVSLR